MVTYTDEFSRTTTIGVGLGTFSDASKTWTMSLSGHCNGSRAVFDSPFF
jgi:hypothetical protein